MRSILAAISMMTIIPPALAQESANWWNPALDAKFRLGIGTGDAPDPKPETSRDAMTVWQFILGTSGSFADNFMPIWQVYSLAENCAAGSQAMDQLSNEFGDHAKAGAAFVAARTRFKEWAATQPQTLSMYGNVTLGSWIAETGQMQVKTYPSNWSTSKQPYTMPLSNGPFFTQGDITHIGVEYSKAYCPSKSGGWNNLPTQMSLGMMFYADRNGALVQGFRLPKSFALSREAAQAFVARSPERKVRAEIQIVPIGRGDKLSNGNQFTKAVTVKRLILRDADGSQLADIAF